MNGRSTCEVMWSTGEPAVSASTCAAGSVAGGRPGAGDDHAERVGHARVRVGHVHGARLAARRHESDPLLAVDRVEDRHVVNGDDAEDGRHADLRQRAGDEIADRLLRGRGRGSARSAGTPSCRIYLSNEVARNAAGNFELRAGDVARRGRAEKGDRAGGLLRHRRGGQAGCPSPAPTAANQSSRVCALPARASKRRCHWSESIKSEQDGVDPDRSARTPAPATSPGSVPRPAPRRCRPCAVPADRPAAN